MERIIKTLIKDSVLTPNNLKARTLSLQLNKSPSYVWDVQNGRSRIEPSFAIELEKLSGIPAIKWMYHQALDEMNEHLESQGENIIPYEDTIIFSSNKISIDNILALREGTIKTSHPFKGNIINPFDGNTKTNLRLNNDNEICWIEKTFESSRLVTFGKLAFTFNPGTQKAYRPQRIKVEWITSKGLINAVFSSVTGTGKLEKNETYIEVTDSNKIEAYTKFLTKCKGIRITMIGATSYCFVNEFEGYEIIK